MNNTTATDLTNAIASLAQVFIGVIKDKQNIVMEDLEAEVLTIGHKTIAKSMELALEAYDFELCAHLPKGHRVHDTRDRQLATQVGDITFSYRRVKDQYGFTYCPLLEALDLAHGTRISPGASSFLIDAGVFMSYEKSAHLMHKAGGSRVSRTTVMNCFRNIGDLCKAEDEQAAKSFYCGGVLPDGEHIAENINVEADGTWIRLQNVVEGEPERVEIKAVVAYDGKVKNGTKTSRTNAIRHACVASPNKFWQQGVAVIGTKYDLSKIKKCDLGVDGETWCKGGINFFGEIPTTLHLDPFHVNRAITACFKDKKLAGKIIGVVWDDGVDSATSLLKACISQGLAAQTATKQAIKYIQNNKRAIEAQGPSMGTMESENQHLYGARMDAVPCAWSVRGASDMARAISRSASKRALPRVTRKGSETKRRKKMYSKRDKLRANAMSSAGTVVHSVGSGYEAPHKASFVNMNSDIRYAAGIDSGMVGIGYW